MTLCVSLCVGECVQVPRHLCGDCRTWRSRFSPFSLWVPGVEVSLGRKLLKYQAISLAHFHPFKSTHNLFLLMSYRSGTFVLNSLYLIYKSFVRCMDCRYLVANISVLFGVLEGRDLGLEF